MMSPSNLKNGSSPNQQFNNSEKQQLQMSPNSKVWIYQSNRPFSQAETQEIQEALNQFTQQWAAHGKGLQATGEIHHQQFIVLMVDESTYGASGCSIDSSVHLMKTIEQKYTVNLFDRLLLAYKDGEQVKTARKADFKRLIQEGKIDAQTIVFNNLVQTKADFATKWQIPLAQSWHKQLMN